jgi:hypothetical protein
MLSFPALFFAACAACFSCWGGRVENAGHGTRRRHPPQDLPADARGPELIPARRIRQAANAMRLSRAREAEARRAPGGVAGAAHTRIL